LQLLQQSLAATTSYSSSGEANNTIGALVVNYQG
jgi:hypothetical protein